MQSIKEKTERLPPNVPACIRFHGNTRLPFGLFDDVSLEGEGIIRGRGEPSGDDVIRTRVGGDGVSAGLPYTGRNIMTL